MPWSLPTSSLLSILSWQETTAAPLAPRGESHGCELQKTPETLRRKYGNGIAQTEFQFPQPFQFLTLEINSIDCKHSGCHPSQTDPVPVTRCVGLPRSWDYPLTNYSVLAKMSTKHRPNRPAPLYERDLSIIMLGEIVEVFICIAPFYWLPHSNSMIGLIKSINAWTLRQSDPCTGLISGKLYSHSPFGKL